MNSIPYTIGLVQINNSFSGVNYLPYSVGLLQAYAEKYLTDPLKFNYLAPVYTRIPVQSAADHLSGVDIAGFSLYVWNERLSLEIMRRLKVACPEVLIICGGPQVPDRCEQFLRDNPFIDVVVHGEGEQAFLNFLENYPSKDWSSISGVSWITSDGKFVTKPKSERIKDLSTIPSPYLEGIFDSLMEENPEREWLILWETNRGCPFQCTFCDWGSAVADRVFRFDLERIYSELDWFSEKKIEFIFNCDANFGILPRDVDIARHAAKNKELSGFPKALSVQNTKNATERAYLTQKILAESGLNKGVTLSMQSVSEQALVNIKRDNISLKTYEVLQQRFTRDGVVTYSDLILGLPGETYDSFSDGVSSLIANGQHNRIQFNNLSTLPNAEMGDPDYLRKYGMELIASEILNIHGAYELSPDKIIEVQQLVVATNSMPRESWRRARVFSWMTALLHFDKLLQLPFIVLHETIGISYRNLIEVFLGVSPDKYPLLAEIRDHFFKRAEEIQNGGPEYYYSKENLGIWWPDDEYQLIRLSTQEKLNEFYNEATRILVELIPSEDQKEFAQVLKESLAINQALLKQPNLKEDVEVDLEYNTLDIYSGVLRGESVSLQRKRSTYRIDRAVTVWVDWETWCREVIWYGNKKGDYLYGSSSLEKYYAGHY
jgi:radical SAM superfamily enzyme YgiQ (UPF0313 family)